MRDENYQPPAYGKSTANNDLLPFKVDPVTGRLLVEIKVVSSLPSNLPGSKIDANRTPAALGVSDDANKEPMPLLTDDDGNLICDVIVE